MQARDVQLDHAVGRAALICTHAMCVAPLLRGRRQRCYSQHSTAGRHVVSFTPGVDGSQRIRSTASATFAGRLANTQDCGHRGSVCTPSPSPQLLPFTRRALTRALHSTAEHATNRTQRSVDLRVFRGHSVGKRLSLLRAAATRPCAAAPSTRRLGPPARPGASPALARRLSCGAGPPPAPPRKGVARTAPAGRQRCVSALLGRSASAGAAAVMLRPPSPRSALPRASRRTCCHARCVSP
jgi:hypothetical protein